MGGGSSSSPDSWRVALRVPPEGLAAADVRLSGLPLLATLPADFPWKAYFRIYVGGRVPDDLPAVVGTYAYVDGRVAFTPRFPFTAGLTYTAWVDVDGLAQRLDAAAPTSVITTQFRVPEPNHAPASVVHISPGSVAPANLLKFHLTFDRPMHEGDVYRHVALIDANGYAVEQAFVETVPELWNDDRTRLTLIMHPGRVKRGLDMHDRMGPGLRAGQSYCLVVSPDMRDANGHEFGEEIRHCIDVSNDDRHSPDPAKWKLTTPAANTREPITINFDEEMDYITAQRMISVNVEGKLVRGQVWSDGWQWTFRPDQPWAEGAYRVAVDPRIEDLAGNRLDRLFDQAPKASAPRLSPRILNVTIN